jgi:hypothetical protein
LLQTDKVQEHPRSKGKAMNRKRKEIMMEKARAKRRRRRPNEALAKAQETGVAAKVIELAEGAAAHVSELVKTAAGKIASA